MTVIQKFRNPDPQAGDVWVWGDENTYDWSEWRILEISPDGKGATLLKTRLVVNDGMKFEGEHTNHNYSVAIMRTHEGWHRKKTASETRRIWR